MIAETLNKLGDTQRNIFLYDTFEEFLTEPTNEDIDYKGNSGKSERNKAKIDKRKQNLWSYNSLNNVERNMASCEYRSDKIHYIKGKIEETIPERISSKICLLRLDTDFYDSTYHELVYLYPNLSQNGILIIDDYGHWQGAQKAVKDYFLEKNINLLLNKIDYTGRLAIKIEQKPN